MVLKWEYQRIITLQMKKILPLIFMMTMAAEPVLAWGGGDCPFSKKGTNQETSTEKADESKSTKKGIRFGKSN